MVKIIWSELAIDDLRNIHQYISQDSIKYASKQVERIISRIDQLEHFPNSGRIVPEFENKVIRELIEGSYRIVYRLYSDHLLIARVHHSSKQIK